MRHLFAKKIKGVWVLVESKSSTTAVILEPEAMISLSVPGKGQRTEVKAKVFTSIPEVGLLVWVGEKLKTIPELCSEEAWAPEVRASAPS